MFFPVGDQNVVGGHKPIVSYTLIALNVIAFIYQITLPQEAMVEFMMYYGAIPQEILQGDNWLSLFTSMFLHGGWMHLLGNMMFLWVFADNIEAVVGSRNFLVFYLLGGLAASVAHIIFNLGSPVPAVGASGAISAVLGAYLVVFPHSRIRTLVFYFFVSIPAIVFLGLWIVQQVISGVGAIGLSSTGGGVAWWAHIGGFVFGLIAGYFIRVSYHPHEIEPYEA